ncbi:dihydrolipoamide acetyltransferase family protein [Halalkalicoccus subterraneus]|uniref:dihydrolipoamide acetyltransferase family protein n=1 Tax=Halalkalicoccus subterraneus TaxID=2675002 RepID=UPI000EFD465A|nr:dihydrolipoamide acetyltransferase family protein [Halalkalicoccus subterraneus]
MVREFKLPDVGEGVAEGEIVQWLVEPGDEVSEDQPVAEVETDKAVVEVPSPVNGSVKEIRAEEGEVVPVGEVIITFAVEGEDEDEEQETAESEEPTESQEQVSEEPADIGDGSEPIETSAGRVFAPPNVRRLARELGVDISSVSGSGPSGRVTEGDVRAADEGSGERSKGPKQFDAGLQSATRKAGESGEGDGSTDDTGAVESADRDRTLAAPATRTLAEEEGLDLNRVPATEERDGEAFVTPEAVKEYAQAQREAKAADAQAVSEAGTGADGEPAEREERVPYRGIRRTIGTQMATSKFTAPHVSHHDTAEVEGLVEARAELKARAEERGVRLTYMPFIMKAIVAVLKEFPEMNASLDEESEEIVVKNYYNVGIAVATDAGLMVPVVKKVDEKGLLQLASEVNDLAKKARERSITREEMQGGTFTITNFGAIGGEYATPIINHPEVAILGLGELAERPIAEDGEVKAAHTLPLSLSIDHRVVDGADAAAFANRVMEYLENPTLLLLE